MKNLLVALFLLPSLSFAATGQLEGPYQATEAAFRSGNASAYLPKLTERSRPLAERLSKYALQDLLPQDIRFIGEQPKGTCRWAQVGRPRDDNTMEMANLCFQKEAGEWKLDLPDSFERALGKKWKQKIALTEALYQGLEAQYGPEGVQKMRASLIQKMQ